jgi:hypothetical protein
MELINADQEPLAYNVRQAATASSLSVRKLSDLIRIGDLRSFKKGRRRIILRKDLEAFLRSGK